ncbi:phosphoribosylformylglycinamidine synthase [Enterobacter cloacae]|uniref:Phosphoribosylformylglycinamidine synthase n=1 Tax=Enterobacter cloacae TaxID=550 RepID=A0A377LVS2_ENTCL|nr:phosphoribosylformylglycinamidine synthase [Enterobacter cloacae]
MNRVLHLPAVAEKTFLVTIGDRTVTGMVSRDQMVGAMADPGGELRRDHREPRQLLR